MDLEAGADGEAPMQFCSFGPKYRVASVIGITCG